MTEIERLNQAIAAHQAGNLDRAEAVYQQLLSENAGNTEALNAYGILHLQGGDLPAALGCFNKAVKLAPTVAKYHNNIGNVQMARNEAVAAIEPFGRAVELEPESADFGANLATARMISGDIASAEEEFKKALSIDPDHYRSRTNLGGLLSKQNRYVDALPHLQRAAQHPECQIVTVLNLISAYEHLNRLDDATDSLRNVGETSHPLARILRARLMRRQGDAAGALAHLRAGDNVAPDVWGDHIAGDWHHELALCGDLTGETEAVFGHCLRAKVHWRRADGDRDGAEYLDSVRRIRRSAAASADASAGSMAGGDIPPLVFFVGFPRSGTTLLEMMLDSHPDVVTTGEADLLSPVLDVLGRPATKQPHRVYLSALDRLFGPIEPTAKIVDKLPLNLVNCRAIDMIFPDARLLVALRDPRDVVLSCLMQRFRRNAGMRNFDTLESTVALYEEVMGLWLDARAGLTMPWLEYRYEDLVADRDATVDRILAFTGIDRHPAMDQYREKAASKEVTTPSYRDVAEPIYSRAVGRWRAYENQLQPALDRLAPFVEAFGYKD